MVSGCPVLSKCPSWIWRVHVNPASSMESKIWTFPDSTGTWRLLPSMSTQAGLQSRSEQHREASAASNLILCWGWCQMVLAFRGSKGKIFTEAVSQMVGYPFCCLASKNDFSGPHEDPESYLIFFKWTSYLLEVLLTALRILSHITISDKLNVSSAGFKILSYFRSLPNTAHIVPLFCFFFLFWHLVLQRNLIPIFFFFVGSLFLSPHRCF